MTISEFLEARIAEDEAEVQAALLLRGSGTHWRIGHPLDPARVLAECAAKRAIIKHAEDMRSCLEDEMQLGWRGPERMAGPDGWLYPFDATPALEALASVYADHPEYDPEWSM